MRTPAVLSLLAASAAAKNAVPALYDGSCYYPKPDIGFDLNSYLGRWYQVAGTIAPYNANCKCTFAQYALNVSASAFLPTKESINFADNSSSRTTAVSASTIPAKPEPALSASSVPLCRLVPSMDRRAFTVCSFLASGLRTALVPTTLCRVSPSYPFLTIPCTKVFVDYTGDFSLVQSNNFSTLFILSREQHPEPKVLDVCGHIKPNSVIRVLTNYRLGSSARGFSGRT